jgi:hypothetical protein
MQKTSVLSLRIPAWKIADYCALYIVLWAVIPVLSRGDIYRYIAVAASIVCLLSILPKKIGRVRNYAFLSLLLILLLILNIGFFAGDYGSAISRAMNMFVFCMIGLISTYYYEYDKYKFSKIALSVLVVYILTAIPSIIALQSNRWILRNASGRSVRTGIEVFAGAYGYAFGCLFLVILLIYDLRNNTHNKAGKVFEIALIALFGYIVINAGYTTALVLLVIGVFAALFFPKKNAIIASFVMVLAAFALLQVVPIFLRWLISNVQISDVYRAKIYYLAQLTNSSSEVTYADSTRGGMFYESLSALARYPFLGSIVLSGKEAATGHAVLLDTLVNHGVLYFLIYLYVIVLSPWRMMKEDKTLQMIYLVMIVLLGLTDTIDYATMAIPLFIGPMIIDNAFKFGRNES